MYASEDRESFLKIQGRHPGCHSDAAPAMRWNVHVTLYRGLPEQRFARSRPAFRPSCDYLQKIRRWVCSLGARP